MLLEINLFSKTQTDCYVKFFPCLNAKETTNFRWKVQKYSSSYSLPIVTLAHVCEALTLEADF